MASKTRERLIEVARQLFMRKGVENTTMLDIAAASDRGRRTLYTYFRNKREIHQAVIEREGEQAVARERAIQQSNKNPEEKLREILRTRFDTICCPAMQKGYERSSLMRLLEGREGKIRRLVAMKEIEILEAVVKEGIDKGVFIPRRGAQVANLVVLVMLGVDSAAARRLDDAIGVKREAAFEDALNFIVESIRKPNGHNDGCQ